MISGRRSAFYWYNKLTMTKQKIRVNVISETEFTVKGHGVHTAYMEMVRALRHFPEVVLSINSRRDSDIVHIHTFGLFALRFLFSGEAKKVVTAHVVPGSWIGSIKFANLWAPLGAKYLRFFYNRADMVIAVSEEVKTILQKEVGVRVPIEVMHNSIDTSQYRKTAKDKAAARRQLKLPPETFVVMGSGQIQPRKRFDLFISLAKAMPDTTLIWVGGVPFKHLGDDYEHIQRLIEDKPENLRVTGVIELEEVKQYYHAADVFFFPSQQETFGLVVVEAAAAGLPVLLRDIPDYDHTFGGDALHGNDDTFQGLLEKLQADQQFYDQARQKSAQIAKRFNSQKSTGRLLEIYRKLLHK